MKNIDLRSSSETLSAPDPNGVCAIIVTYFPDSHFPERLARISEQVAKIIIVDNTGETNAGTIAQHYDNAKIEIIRNEENAGIGTALNQGVARAIVLGYEWVISFDQDSWIHSDLVTVLIEIYHLQRNTEMIGIIGCNFEDENTRTVSLKNSPGGPIYREIEAVITSGALLSVAAFSKAGPFRSDFFIDFVDHEYCLRLLKLGYKVLISTAPLMVHAFGAGTVWNSSGGNTWLSFHLSNRSPLRRYYMTRNGLVVARNYFTVAPKWVLGSVMSLLVVAPLKIPWEKGPGWQKFRATFRGLLDALRGRTGKATAVWLNG